jgi:hypothetical protein
MAFANKAWIEIADLANQIDYTMPYDSKNKIPFDL